LLTDRISGGHTHPKDNPTENMMPKITLAKHLKRLLLCLAILVVHYLSVFVPISELFLLYIIFFKPKYFDEF